MNRAVIRHVISLVFLTNGLFSLACSSDGDTRPRDQTGSGGAGIGTTTGGIGGSGIIGSGGSGNMTGGDTPATCAEAAQARTYIGCDFWPTETYNPAYVDFKFAAVIANAGSVDAEVTIERAGMMVATATVPAAGLKAVTLPWVMELKGNEFARTIGNEGARRKTSVLVKGGAFHLTSSVPVTVWQFNPLDYQQPVQNCPGLPATSTACLSVSNDASLLLPSTAMTGNYRLFGRSARNEGGGETWGSSQGGFAVTATQNDTTVNIQLAPATMTRPVEVGVGAKIGPAQLSAGPGITAAGPGTTIMYTLQAGDVMQLIGEWGKFEPEPHGDLSGSILKATKPVQVIAMNALLNGVPTATNGNPDHLEETVLPAEVIGKSYIVTPPTGPHKQVPGHMVRFFGNVAGATLTYPDGAPADAPTRLEPGDVFEIGPVKTPFVVNSDQPFAVASIMLGGTVQDPIGKILGDPSITMYVTPEQFRKQYTFLAPTNYLENYADVLLPQGATATLDGTPLAGTPEPIGMSGWSLVREPLQAGANNGAHVLEATAPAGLQVLGFGQATGYCYPGGLNLKLISVPPDIK